MQSVRVLGGYTSRVKLVIDKRRPEAYWPEERWRPGPSRPPRHALDDEGVIAPVPSWLTLCGPKRATKARAAGSEGLGLVAVPCRLESARMTLGRRGVKEGRK
jgi:hypothetical protein